MVGLVVRKVTLRTKSAWTANEVADQHFADLPSVLGSLMTALVH